MRIDPELVFPLLHRVALHGHIAFAIRGSQLHVFFRKSRRARWVQLADVPVNTVNALLKGLQLPEEQIENARVLLRELRKAAGIHHSPGFGVEVHKHGDPQCPAGHARHGCPGRNVFCRRTGDKKYKCGDLVALPQEERDVPKASRTS